jgi:hypothetical protein
MKKNITGLVFLAIGCFGIFVFVDRAVDYAMSLSLVSSSRQMVVELVKAYNFQNEYFFAILLIIVGIVLLLIEPVTKLISIIKK